MVDPPARVAQTRATTDNIVVSMQAFVGPLPSPEVLQAYEHAFPGSAERIIAMAERQSAHRRSMEELAAQTSREHMVLDYREGRRGQYCALLVALGFIAGGVLVAKIGQPWAGALLGGGGICLQVLVTTFVRGRQAQVAEKPAASDKGGKRAKK